METDEMFNCSSCTKTIGIGAATIFDGRCQQCFDVESGYGVTDTDPADEVVVYDDLIETHNQAIVDGLKELP
jgi:hypothetical protein